MAAKVTLTTTLAQIGFLFIFPDTVVTQSRCQSNRTKFPAKLKEKLTLSFEVIFIHKNIFQQLNTHLKKSIFQPKKITKNNELTNACSTRLKQDNEGKTQFSHPHPLI